MDQVYTGICELDQLITGRALPGMVEYTEWTIVFFLYPEHHIQ